MNEKAHGEKGAHRGYHYPGVSSYVSHARIQTPVVE